MNTDERQHEGSVILLGPQSWHYADVTRTINELDIDGPIALVTAGWQENESDDSGLQKALDRPTINLSLHARSEGVADAEADFVAAWTLRQKHLRRLQEFYRIRLQSIDKAAGSIAVRHASSELLEEQLEISVSQLRHLDADHLQRCATIRERFDNDWPISSLPSLESQREEVAEELQACKALIITGGHVVAVLNRLRLFDVFATWDDRPIIGWSAGAMVLTERIVLFHDSPPFGTNLAQVLDTGFGLCPDLVALPDMSRRVHLDQKGPIGRFSRRMAPAHCLALDPGSRIRFEDGKMTAVEESARLDEDGQVNWGWTP